MSQDKQFEPTPRRRERAREKGEAPHSRDFTAAGLLLIVAMMGPRFFTLMAQAISVAAAHTLGSLHQFDFTATGLRQAFQLWGTVVVSALAPLFLTVSACAIVLSYFQTGPILSAYPITPRLDKLNPAHALKRLFSLRGFIETLKSLLKLALVAVTAYLVLRHRASDVLLLGQVELQGSVTALAHLMWELTLKTALMMVILGAADYAYQRFEHGRALRMTREEMREEIRETEGDPLVRGKRRQRRQQFLRDGMSARLPQANVVLTNPTHLAVALYYRQTDTKAPLVVARGRGRLAERIKRVARRYAIPIREEPPLARALYQACPLGAEIPQALYRAVAIILAELYKESLTRRQSKRGNLPL